MAATTMGTFYILVALMCVMILGLILRRLICIKDRNFRKKKLILSIIIAIAICVADTFTGLFYYGVITSSGMTAYALSFVAHSLVLMLSYTWFLYSEEIQESHLTDTLSGKIVCALPGILVFLLLVSNRNTKLIFYFEKNGTYHRGSLFSLFVIAECGYVLFSAIKALYFSFMPKHYEDRIKLRIVASYAFLPIISGIIQRFVVVSPVFTCGITLGFLLVYSNLYLLFILQDSLTGLANMNAFDAYIANRIKHISQYGQLYLISIDIDDFNEINNKMGVDEGNRILETTAVVIKNTIYEYDGFASRSGADEFLIVIESANEHTVRYVCDSIAKQLIVEDISISTGYAKYTNQTIPQLICEAAQSRQQISAHTETKNNKNSLVHIDKSPVDISGLEGDFFPVLSAWSDKNYIFVTNMQTNVTRWTTNAMKFMGEEGEYMRDAGEKWRSCIHPDDVMEYQKEVDAVFSGRKKCFDKMYRVRGKDGIYVSCTGFGQFIPGKNGEPDLFAGAIVNNGISDNIDSITNLWDTHAFSSFLGKTLEKTRNAAVLVIGICKYGHVNDTYGYVLGNELLKQFADELFTYISPKKRLFRLDGAKFAFECEDGDEKLLSEIYDNAKEIVKSKLFLGEYHVPLRIAGGAVVVHNYEGEKDTILTSAMYALEISKHEKHGEIVFFDNKANESDIGKVNRIVEIHKCVTEGCRNFMLYYQPIVNAKTGAIEGAEALIRWKNDEYGLVSPDQFIPWMEEDPCIYTLGNWIIETAIEAALEFRKFIPDFFININIAATQLENLQFRNDLLEIVKSHGFPKDALWIELTERCKDLDHTFLMQEIEFFRENGIQIALDDYGTGASSLSLAIELPVAEVKIDKSFVSGIKNDTLKQALVESIIAFARKLDIRCCIEGIEDTETADFLLQYDPMYYQGYAYSKPVPEADFMKLIEEQYRVLFTS